MDFIAEETFPERRSTFPERRSTHAYTCKCMLIYGIDRDGVIIVIIIYVLEVIFKYVLKGYELMSTQSRGGIYTKLMLGVHYMYMFIYMNKLLKKSQKKKIYI